MTLSTVNYASKSEAYVAAEALGFDKPAVRVSRDAGSNRWQWEVRAVWSQESAEADALAKLAAGATMEQIEGKPLITDMRAEEYRPVAPDPSGEGAAEVASVLEVTDAVIGAVADAPTLPEGWSTVEGGIITEPVSAGSGFMIARAADEAAPEAEPSPPVQPVAASGDVIMQVHSAMPVDAMRQYAQAFADKHLAIVTLRDAISFAVVATIAPGGSKRGHGSSVARASGSVTGGADRSAASARPESLIDRIRARGEWADSEVVASNITILNLKHRIEKAAQSDDLDALTALGTFRSTSTYYNQAREYLGWHVAAVERRIAEREAKHAADLAAIDREFGFAVAAE